MEEEYEVNPFNGDIVLENLEDVDLVTLMRWRTELFDLLSDIHKNKDYGNTLLYSFVTNLQVVIIGIERNLHMKQSN